MAGLGVPPNDRHRGMLAAGRLPINRLAGLLMQINKNGRSLRIVSEHYWYA
jgi:hypothetical protein